MVREKNTAPAILGGSLVIVVVWCSSERPSVLAPLMGRVGLLGGGPGTYYHPFSQIDALITCRSVINSTQVGQHRLSLPCLNWGVPGCLIACSDTRGLPGTIPGGWCCGWKWWLWNSETMQSCRGENQLPGGERVSWAVQESRVHISRSLIGEVPGGEPLVGSL